MKKFNLGLICLALFVATGCNYDGYDYDALADVDDIDISDNAGHSDGTIEVTNQEEMQDIDNDIPEAQTEVEVFQGDSSADEIDMADDNDIDLEKTPSCKVTTSSEQIREGEEIRVTVRHSYAVAGRVVTGWVSEGRIEHEVKEISRLNPAVGSQFSFDEDETRSAGAIFLAAIVWNEEGKVARCSTTVSVVGALDLDDSVMNDIRNRIRGLDLQFETKIPEVPFGPDIDPEKGLVIDGGLPQVDPQLQEAVLSHGFGEAIPVFETISD